MEENKFDLWGWWKKYGEHLTAPLILIAVVILAVGVWNNHQSNKLISQECGWGEEDFYCFCEKSDYYKMKNKFELDTLGGGLNLNNTTFTDDKE